MARLKAAGDATRERLAALIETSLNRVFDAPLDVRNAYEALHAIAPNDPATTAPAAVRRAAEWGAGRAARRIGLRFGSKVAGRAVAPIGMAVEFGLSARDGIRELQVLASFLGSRLRMEGHPLDPELVRRTVLGIYLEPRNRPDLRIAPHRRAMAVAKRWSVNTLPLTGRRQSTQSHQRVEAIAGLALAQLVGQWQALEGRVGPPAEVIEAHLVTDRAARDRPSPTPRPSSLPRPGPPPPPPPPRPPA